MAVGSLYVVGFQIVMIFRKDLVRPYLKRHRVHVLYKLIRILYHLDHRDGLSKDNLFLCPKLAECGRQKIKDQVEKLKLHTHSELFHAIFVH